MRKIGQLYAMKTKLFNDESINPWIGAEHFLLVSLRKTDEIIVDS